MSQPTNSDHVAVKHGDNIVRSYLSMLPRASYFIPGLGNNES